MAQRIAIVQGHPNPDGARLCHALAYAYAEGAAAAGREVKRIDVARLEFHLLRTEAEFKTGLVPPDVKAAQEIIRWADHLVIVYPLWLGTMPALLKGFLEQVFRPAFAFEPRENGLWTKLLKGRSARIVITMGMPALFYRWYFGAHSLKSLERNILGFAGIGPIREDFFGMVENATAARRRKWLDRMTELGRRGV